MARTKQNSEQYVFHTDRIQEGQEFKSFKALFLAVTDREPPTGKKNLDKAKERMKRCLEYEKIQDGKQPVRVTKIYDPPLDFDDGRGHDGPYINNLRPLIIEQDHFFGKISELQNVLGLFSRYREPLQGDGSSDHNIWSWSKTTPVGESIYKDKINGQLNSRIKDALNSLQKDGIIVWQEKYVVYTKEILAQPYDNEYDLLSRQEIREKANAALRSIKREVKKYRACTLLAKDLRPLLPGTNIAWRDCCEDEVKKYYRTRSHEATLEQVEAIEKYELFIMQCAYKEYKGLSELPEVSELPGKKKFFSIFRLHQAYNKCERQYNSMFFGTTRFWKEIEYKVVDYEKAQKYLGKSEFAAARVSKQALSFMDERMKTEMFYPKGKELEDLRGFGEQREGYKHPLKHSKSATKLHNKLKALYGEDIPGEKGESIGCRLRPVREARQKDFLIRKELIA